MAASLTTLENAERTAELSTKTTQGTGLFSNTTAYAAQVLRNQKVRPVGAVEPPSVILSARGTFYLVKLSDTYGPGIYAIDELTREVLAPNFVGPTASQNWNTQSPILLTSIEFNQVDITSQVPCLNNVKVFYSFGQNFGQVVIQGEVLLGPLGNMSYAGVERLVSFFWRNRVSIKRQPIAVSVADNAYFVYLTGLRIGQVVADFHIMPFVMFGTLLDITREKASVVNRQGQVITGGTLNEPSLFNALRQMPDDSQATVTKPGETKTTISVGNQSPDDALNSGAAITGNAGVNGNSTAAQLQSDLTNGSVTQEEKDLALMKAEKQKKQERIDGLKRAAGDNPSNDTLYQIENAQLDLIVYESKIATQEGRVMGAKNLAAGGKAGVQPTVTPEQTAACREEIDRLNRNQSATATPGSTFVDPRTTTAAQRCY